MSGEIVPGIGRKARLGILFLVPVLGMLFCQVGKESGNVEKFVVSERFGEGVHLFPLLVFLMVATDACLEFLELLQDIPILQAGERRAAKDQLSGGIVAMAGHAVFPEEFTAFVDIPLESEEGLNTWQVSDVCGQQLEILRLQGVGNGSHFDAIEILGFGATDVFLKFADLSCQIPFG